MHLFSTLQKWIDSKCQEELGLERSWPTLKGFVGCTRRPTGPLRAGHLSGGFSGLMPVSWEEGLMRQGISRTWESWLKCWKLGKSRKSNSEILIPNDYLICRECWEQQHYDPSIFKTDPGGIVYDREHKAPDWLFDQWHPWEKVCQSCLYFPCLINQTVSGPDHGFLWSSPAA